MKISKESQPFYSRLSYSFGNEDPTVERKALNSKSTDRIFCITASGDRPLHLLLDDCAEIVAVDLNETQNHLLNLKTQAMKQLDYDSYLAFLGAKEDNLRLEKLEQLLPHMNEQSHQFWKHNKKMVNQGVLYQGAVEKWCKKSAGILKFLRGNKVKRLFEFENIEEQQQFVNKHWNSFLWKKTFDLLFNLPLMRLILKDPGIFAYLGQSISPGKYIFQRLTQSLCTSLASENHLLSLVFLGHVGPKAYPPYLTEEGVATIKPRLHKLSWKTENAITLLENSPACSFDAFSLSDIASYMSSHDFQRLLIAIHRAAKPGARFSIRQFMSDHHIPDALTTSFNRNKTLEQSLEAEERCFVYRFMAGTIDK